MVDQRVFKKRESHAGHSVDLHAFIDAVESGALDSAHAILSAWHSQSCAPDCSSLIPDLFENRQYESRLLPLLQRWDRQKLIALGLVTVLDQLLQQSVPTAISALAQFAPGWFVISGCRPSSEIVDVVVLSLEGNYYCHQIKDRPFKYGCNRHSEGLLGFNYSFIGILNLPPIQGIHALWINGTRVDFHLQNLESASYIDQIDDLLYLYRQSQVPFHRLSEVLGCGGLALSQVLSEPLKCIEQWPSWIRQDHSFGLLSSDQMKTTIVIPLFRLWHDFMQGHLAAFSMDPAFREGLIEVLYVIDDPTIEDQVLNWSRIYLSDCPYPVRIISLERNFGFGMACNIAVKAAHTNRVILMNSDVMPIESGWIDCLENTCSLYPEALVSPVLLYDNFTIQHVGMQIGFSGSKPRIPCNLHLMKGFTLNQYMQSDLEISNSLVDALSGAVLAFSRDLFLSIGGFDPIFGRGDFEDLDLSIRWKQAYGDLKISRDTQLVHLERQTMDIFAVDDKQWQERFNACCAFYLRPELQQLAGEMMP